MSIILPFKFKKIHRRFKNRQFTLLDVGCGNHSATLAKQWFPHCRYHGLDMATYNNSERDFSLMEKYYQIDLSLGSINELPDNYFDVVIFSHVIEHIRNGLEIVAQLTIKMKRNGYIFIEFPSVSSLALPNWKGTLNFCDDPSHIRIYDIREIANTLLENQCTILRAGARRDWRVIVFFVPLFIKAMIAERKIPHAGLWDIFHFADYVFAKKNV